MSNHTKGEWVVTNHKETGIRVVSREYDYTTGKPELERQDFIAQISTHHLLQLNEPDQDTADKVAQANARLIAASPALFKALSDLTDAFLYEALEKHGKPYVTGEFPAYDLAISALKATE